MLRAIKKFVFGRDRNERRGSQDLVENGSSEHANNPDSAPQDPAGEFETTPVPPVWGRVKWFNPTKHYGFVALSDGSGDVFLHATALAGLGISALQPGETLEFRVTVGERGPQVAEVISVDSSTAAPSRPPRKGPGRSQSDRQYLTASSQEMGTVKWYNATKGFGFVVPDGGGKDIFVHASALERAGILRLSEGQRVLISVAEGRKGPEAASIQAAD
jgi:cold shock protein